MRRCLSVCRISSPAASRQHEVEQDEIEHLGIRSKEPVFARGGHDDVLVLGLQRGGQHLGQLAFIFDNQDTHQIECYRPILASILTFVSGTAEGVGV